MNVSASESHEGESDVRFALYKRATVIVPKPIRRSERVSVSKPTHTHTLHPHTTHTHTQSHEHMDVTEEAVPYRSAPLARHASSVGGGGTELNESFAAWGTTLGLSDPNPAGEP